MSSNCHRLLCCANLTFHLLLWFLCVIVCLLLESEIDNHYWTICTLTLPSTADSGIAAMSARNTPNFMSSMSFQCHMCFCWVQSEWYGRSLYDFINPDDVEKLREQLSTNEAQNSGRILDLKSMSYNAYIYFIHELFCCTNVFLLNEV